MPKLSILMKDQIELVQLEYNSELQLFQGDYQPSQQFTKTDYDIIVQEMNQHKKPRIKHRYIAIPLIIIPIIWTIIVVALFSENLRWLIIIGWLLIVVYWIVVSIVDSVRLEKIKESCTKLSGNFLSKGLVVQMQDSDVIKVYFVAGLVCNV